MAGAHCAHAVVSFVLSEVLEEDVVKNESEDEIRGRHPEERHSSSTDCTTNHASSSFYRPWKTTAVATNAFSTVST